MNNVPMIFVEIVHVSTFLTNTQDLGKYHFNTKLRLYP